MSVTFAPTAEERKRCQQLVRDNLAADLRNLVVTERLPDETILLVLSRRQTGPFIEVEYRNVEYITRRACLSTKTGEAMLVWGHYFNGRDAIVRANADFAKRSGEDT